MVTGGNELLQVVMSGYGRLCVQSEAKFYKQTDIQPVGIIYRSLSSSSPSILNQLSFLAPCAKPVWRVFANDQSLLMPPTPLLMSAAKYVIQSSTFLQKPHYWWKNVWLPCMLQQIQVLSWSTFHMNCLQNGDRKFVCYEIACRWVVGRLSCPGRSD